MHKGQLADGMFEKKLLIGLKLYSVDIFTINQMMDKYIILVHLMKFFGMTMMIQKDFIYSIHLQENLNE